MSRISHREFRTWLAWRKDALNKPSRSDYYLMKLMGFVEHVMSSKAWDLKQYQIKFLTDGSVRSGDPKEAKRALARRRGEDI